MLARRDRHCRRGAGASSSRACEDRRRVTPAGQMPNRRPATMTGYFERSIRRLCRWTLAIGLAVLALSPAAIRAEEPQHDLLNAVLWMQRSVEYKANSLGVFALARMRLDQA